jgi:dCMP deaminase
MFIGIAGPICSGKRTIANFLISNHDFTRLRLRQVNDNTPSNLEFDTSTPVPTPPAEEPNPLSNGIKTLQINGNGDVWFDTMSDMTEYVTKRWRENFVTVDIWKEEDLEIISKRPFFLLISVDAPITIRWNRFNER